MKIPGITKFINYLTRITTAQRIAKIPRMFASEYSELSPDDARIMARYGIRSPSGLRLAMKKYKVTTVDELVGVLEHHQPRRRIKEKFLQAVSRLSTGVKHVPYQRDIRHLVSTRYQDKAIQERLKRLRE